MRVVCVRECECVGVSCLLSTLFQSRSSLSCSLSLSLSSFPTPHPFSPLLSLCVSISVPSRTRPSLSGRVCPPRSRAASGQAAGAPFTRQRLLRQTIHLRLANTSLGMS